MEFDEINRILDMMREHELSEFELEHEGFKIRIKKGAPLNAPAGVLRATVDNTVDAVKRS